VKGVVYRTRVEDVAALHARVLKAIQSMTKGVSSCMGVELVHCIDMFRITGGSHAETDYSTHTLSKLSNNLQKTRDFHQFWLSSNTFLKQEQDLVENCVSSSGYEQPFIYNYDVGRVIPSITQLEVFN
jgi:hypothetical protein